MNPRYRRLLIPGLLVVLIAVVLVTSLNREAHSATLAQAGADVGYDVVSTITDPRITESSGLVLSNRHPDLAYTINDSGNAATVFAIRVSTGKVVGTTKVTGGTLLDTEALSIDSDGTLWIADTGDNNSSRNDVALYALPEPGEGDHSVKAHRFAVAYADGPHDVETLLINPKTNKKYLIGKGLLGGEVYLLPAALTTDAANKLAPINAEVPLLLTDGAFTPDGRYAVLRSYIAIHVFDVGSWHQVRTEPLPYQKQGETLAMESAGDSLLVGSEGADSRLLRLGFSVEANVPVPAGSTARPAESADADGSPSGGSGLNSWVISVAAVAVVAAGALVVRQRR